MRKKNMQRRLKGIFRELNAWNGLKVLDVGCSGGMLLHLLSNHCLEVFGLDINDSVLRATDFGEDFICGNAMRMPLKDESFDVIICSHLLEHLPSFDACIQEMQRISRIGARIFILYPIEIFRGATCIPDVLIHGQRLSLIRKIHLHKLSLKKLRRSTEGIKLSIVKHKLIFALQPMFMAVLTKEA
ncbi:MAG: class I SAM-dependent methyltransferase [bacterium]